MAGHKLCTNLYSCKNDLQCEQNYLLQVWLAETHRPRWYQCLHQLLDSLASCTPAFCWTLLSYFFLVIGSLINISLNFSKIFCHFILLGCRWWQKCNCEYWVGRSQIHLPIDVKAYIPVLGYKADNYYAEGGGHTVVRLSLCVSVVPSVTSVLRHTLQGEHWNLQST